MSSHQTMFEYSKTTVEIDGKKVNVSFIKPEYEAKMVDLVYDSGADGFMKGKSLFEQLSHCRVVYESLPYALYNRKFNKRPALYKDKKAAWEKGEAVKLWLGDARVWSVLATREGLLLGLFIDGNDLLWIGETVTVAHIDTTGDNNGAGYKGGEDSYTPLSLVLDPDLPTCVGEGGYVPTEEDRKASCLALPDGITAVPPYAFSGCDLEEITIPEGVKSIERHAFEGCKKLKTVHFPSTLEKIGISAFSECEALERVRLGAHMQTVERYAFFGCVRLSFVDFGSTHTVAAYAFMNAGALTEIRWDAVRSLGSFAFARCERLTRLVLPETLSFVDTLVFQECVSLREVTFRAMPEEYECDAFYGCDALRLVHLPAAFEDTFREALEDTDRFCVHHPNIAKKVKIDTV